MSAHEKANAQAGQGSSIAKGAAMGEEAHAEGRYVFECFDRDGNLKWRDTIDNLVVTEGKNAALTHFLKGSSYTASQVLGLIESTGYSAIGAGNTAAGITAAGGGSPTNGWNEAPSSVAATRGTPAFGTASAGALATSSAVAFSILAARTIKGAFLLCRSAAGTAPATTVGGTAGALYSAGLFSGGDRAVDNGDTLNVSYTASL
jgi:hypothetical protein